MLYLLRTKQQTNTQRRLMCICMTVRLSAWSWPLRLSHIWNCVALKRQFDGCERAKLVETKRWQFSHGAFACMRAEFALLFSDLCPDWSKSSSNVTKIGGKHPTECCLDGCCCRLRVNVYGYCTQMCILQSVYMKELISRINSYTNVAVNSFYLVFFFSFWSFDWSQITKLHFSLVFR